jgi:hypothetical protein
LNSHNTDSAKYPKGLAFGGDTDHARIWIDDDIYHKSYVTEDCGTFQPGALAPNREIFVTSLEIWGCGGVGALDALKYHQS